MVPLAFPDLADLADLDDLADSAELAVFVDCSLVDDSAEDALKLDRSLEDCPGKSSTSCRPDPFCNFAEVDLPSLVEFLAVDCGEVTAGHGEELNGSSAFVDSGAVSCESPLSGRPSWNNSIVSCLDGC